MARAPARSVDPRRTQQYSELRPRRHAIRRPSSVSLRVGTGSDEEKEKFAFVFGGVIYRFPGGLRGLRPAVAETDRFNEDRVGLDHLSFRSPE